jgi:hypothetical protein
MAETTATFTIESWDESPVSEAGGVTVSRATVTKTFRGGLVGTSTTELLMTRTPVEGSMAYVALERLDVSLGGRDGTFVLQHAARGVRGDMSGVWDVVTDSGTGELRGIAGDAEIAVDPDGTHTLRLRYRLG